MRFDDATQRRRIRQHQPIGAALQEAWPRKLGDGPGDRFAAGPDPGGEIVFERSRADRARDRRRIRGRQAQARDVGSISVATPDGANVAHEVIFAFALPAFMPTIVVLTAAGLVRLGDGEIVR